MLVLRQCLRHFNPVVPNITITNVRILKDVLCCILAPDCPHETVQIVCLHTTALILLMLHPLLFFHLLSYLPLKPFLRKLIIVKLLNMNAKAFNTRTIHGFQDPEVSPLLILADVGNLSRFDQFPEALQNGAMKVLYDGPALHERHQAYLGPPAPDEESKVHLPEHPMPIRLIYLDQYTLAHGVHVLYLFV